MVEQATPIRSKHTDGGNRQGHLLEELHRSQEEVLRLRDQLIAMNAELGAARGRVAELEAGTGRLLNLIARVRSRMPGPLSSATSRLLRRSDSQG